VNLILVSRISVFALLSHRIEPYFYTFCSIIYFKLPQPDPPFVVVGGVIMCAISRVLPYPHIHYIDRDHIFHPQAYMGWFYRPLAVRKLLRTNLTVLCSPASAFSAWWTKVPIQD
jgi:hypothetical protein